MNYQRLTITISVVILVVSLGFGLLHRFAKSNEIGKPLSANRGSVPQVKRAESVGWVFGRMIGFKGADRPMMPRRPLAP